MLELKNIKKSYGRYTALNGLDISIKDGALYGLIGPNGAGKTTAIKILAGLLKPDEGQVIIDNTDMLEDKKNARLLIGYVPDFFGVYDNLTVYEYMSFFAMCYGIKGLVARKRCRELLEEVGLADKEDFYVDSLSRGMQQRLCLARALIHNPKFIILDEPTSGLDPRTRYDFKELMKSLAESGKTVLVSSHILSELSQICTDIGIIDQGRLIMSGDVESILRGVEQSNPLHIRVLNGEKTALGIFKKNPGVLSISQKGKEFLINYSGSIEDEAAVLQQLIDADIPVSEFAREAGSLEAFFMQITDYKKEQVIQSSDY